MPRNSSVSMASKSWNGNPHDQTQIEIHQDRIRASGAWIRAPTWRHRPSDHDRTQLCRSCNECGHDGHLVGRRAADRGVRAGRKSSRHLRCRVAGETLCGSHRQARPRIQRGKLERFRLFYQRFPLPEISATPLRISESPIRESIEPPRRRHPPMQ